MKNLMAGLLGAFSLFSGNAHAILRGDFFYQGGYFHENRVETGAVPTFTETINGVRTYFFQLERRTDTYTQIWDRSRGIIVRLFADHFEVSTDAAHYRYFKPGYFDNRTDYWFRTASGAISRFSLESGNEWSYYNGDTNTKTTYKETYRGSSPQSSIAISANSEIFWLGFSEPGVFHQRPFEAMTRFAVGQWNQPPS